MASLEEALGVCKGSVTLLLCRLVGFGEVKIPPADAYTFNQFFGEWKSKGKSLVEDKWRDAANTLSGHDVRSVDDVEGETGADGDREMIQGKHEWIPTSELGYLVMAAAMHKDIRWVYLAEVLRTPTRIVVATPKDPYLYAPQSRLAGDLGLTGHVGALYVPVSFSYKARFKAQAKFHDELRVLLRTYLTDKVSDPKGFGSKLQEHITERYWRGDIGALASALNAPLQALKTTKCPYCYLSGTNAYTSFGATMNDMAMLLTEQWAISDAVMKNQLNAMDHLPSMDDMTLASVLANPKTADPDEKKMEM